MDIPEYDCARAAQRLNLPSASRAVVVLVDGLGFEQLNVRLGHAPYLRRLMKDAQPIQTVVPSTTAAAVTALGTAAQPGQTAMAGYSLKDPDTGDVFNLIAWNSPTQRAEEWQKVPTVAENMAAHGHQLATVQLAKFTGSGLTNAAWRGTVPYAATRIDQRVEQTLDALNDHQLVYFYWGELDHTGHKHGWQSEEWTAQLELLDATLRELSQSLPSDTLLVITADHGMVDVTERVDVATIPELYRGVELIAGEERFVHIYTSEPADVAHRWATFFGERVTMLTQDQVYEAGIMGELSDQCRDVMGDVIAIPTGTLGIGDSRTMSANALTLRGLHGGMSHDEMNIPCLREVV